MKQQPLHWFNKTLFYWTCFCTRLAFLLCKQVLSEKKRSRESDYLHEQVKQTFWNLHEISNCDNLSITGFKAARVFSRHDLNKIHDTVIPCECENYYSKFDFSGSTEIYLRCDIVSFTSWMRKGGDGEKETDFQTGKHTVERSPTNITRTARDVGTLWQLKIAVLRCVLYMCWGVGLNEIEKVYQWWWTSGDKPVVNQWWCRLNNCAAS